MHSLVIIAVTIAQLPHRTLKMGGDAGPLLAVRWLLLDSFTQRIQHEAQPGFQ